MRVSVLLTAISVMAAAPVWAQSPVNLARRTTLPAHVMCSDLLVSAMPVPSIVLKGAHHSEVRLAMNRGDTAVVARTPDDGLAVGQRYLVRRLPVGAQLSNLRSGGHVAVQTPGWLTITAVDEVNALAHVDYSCDALEAGDYLEPFTELTLPAPDASAPAPDFTERVTILPGAGGREMFADGDTFSIARGIADGLVAGARFAIYRDRKDGKPLVHIGEAIVVEPTATSAKMLLMTTTDAVYTNDIAVPRR